MIKNRAKKIDVKWEIRKLGNWNFRQSHELSCNTKPIAVVTLDMDEFVFRHDDIFEIIKAYHEAVKQSIAMIRQGQAGNINFAEMPLLDKIALLIKDLKNNDSMIRDSQFLKDGQKALRI